MKKVLLSCALATMAVLPSVASASELTINPMVGSAYTKATGASVALGLEAGYSNFILGYTYTGDKDESKSVQIINKDAFPDFDLPNMNLTTYSNETYKAHSVYAGYKFDLGPGQFAVKAGVEYSKYGMSEGLAMRELNAKSKFTGNKAGMSIDAISDYELSPMVGIGYHLKDTGLNFNLHYTFQNGSRDMNVSGTAYSNKNKVVTPTHREKNAVSNKDFGTVMFTVGYRF